MISSFIFLNYLRAGYLKPNDRLLSRNFGTRPLAKNGKKIIDFTSKLGIITYNIVIGAKFILKIELF